jgi:predicted methyltransferase
MSTAPYATVAALISAAVLAVGACAPARRPATPAAAPATADATLPGPADQRAAADERPAPPAPAAAAAPPADEANVAPTVNDPYRASTSVDPWIERLEREGREVRDRKPELLRALALRPGQIVADVGAGTGLFTFDLAAAVGRGGHVFAVDVTPVFLAHLRARVASTGVGNVTVVEGDARDPKLAPGSVDVVFACDVYHHLEYPQTTLAHLRAALRPGGELWIIDFEREPGRSPAWILEHVRAGRAQVLAELAEAGFELVAAPELLKDNYVLRLRPTAR